MQQMNLAESRSTVKAPNPEVISLPGFYRATNGSVCTVRCGVLISVTHIPGSDAVKISYAVPVSTPTLFEVTWEEECTTHEAMLSVLQRMCVKASSESGGQI